MPSRRGAWRWLLAKEWRELMASRAWWIMLGLIGPLVGLSFISAVRGFAEVSEGAGVGCGAVCAPLDGIWAPTFSAYELAAIFLLPFVAIRLVSGDRQSGALKLELQHPMNALARLAAKVAVLLAGWLVAMTAAAVGMILWTSYGGAHYAPEIAVVAFGHVLNAGLVIALAAAAASVAEHPSTAAILTLGVTVGTWIIDFAAAVSGGVWERLAAFTPASMVSNFQRGLVEVNVVLIALVLTLTGLGVAAVWLRLGVRARRRGLESVALVASAALVVFGCTFIRGSWDASESRRNSFPEPAEEALERITSPLKIEAHLAPVDPRRLEIERQAFGKLRRAMDHVQITYVARTTTGLFEEADPGYGEVWYELDGKRAMSHTTTEDGVLETILGLTGAAPDAESDSDYRGRPLVARPVGAAAIFYGVWPTLVGGASYFALRRHV